MSGECASPGRTTSPLLTRPFQHINSVVFSAPFLPDKVYLTSLPFGDQKSPPHAIYHGPTSFMSHAPDSASSPASTTLPDPYAAAKQLGIFHEIGQHAFQGVNAGQIVQRIMRSRGLYEERQRLKGLKAGREEEVKTRELDE